ncbi:TolC family protein [Reichenbachiella versicolor]|uniref:TolC family protein n=1 Tax=Reichenbachiella versicolor TaxID=1821036 RepID=UPI0013A55144|nr:TolC family protein [Reichenbachiella versicolor]
MNKYLLIALSFLMSSKVAAQEILTKADAVAIALENNFDIRAIKTDVSAAENNAKITNSGYLPNLSGNAGADYSKSWVKQNGAKPEITNYSAGLRMDYTVFDGFGRKYSYAKLKEDYNLTDLQARFTMENTLLNLFSSYYEIARLTQNQINQEQTLSISRERLQRAKYSFEYGQNTQLDVLNAEVDYNSDSINYLTNSQQLENEKHNLNLLLGRDINTVFEVDTTLTFTEDLNLGSSLSDAKERNVSILQQQGNVRNAYNQIKVENASIIPKIGVYSSYGWSESINPFNVFPEVTRNTIGVGASLSWNIWDGGISNTRRQNSRLAKEKQEITLEQTTLDLERNVSNAWTAYQTALFVMEAQAKNLETNQRNFDRTKEQYSLGQVTNIVFRQAQFNLLTAQLNYSQAKYSAKNAELALLQLSGNILKASY